MHVTPTYTPRDYMMGKIQICSVLLLVLQNEKEIYFILLNASDLTQVTFVHNTLICTTGSVLPSEIPQKREVIYRV